MNNLIVLSLFFLAIIIVFGCKNEKEIVSFQNNNMQFSIVGYAKSSPFSPDPNIYCFLEVPEDGFMSDKIVYMLLFNEVNDGLCAIYENINGQKLFISGLNKGATFKIKSVEDVLSIKMQIGQLDDFSFKVLGIKFSLNEVECVLFNWHGGGIQFFSFNDYREGLAGSLGYNIEGKYELSQSGKIIFTDWKKNSDSWPLIKEIHFPLKGNTGAIGNELNANIGRLIDFK